MTAEHLTTLENIHKAAKREFLEKGYIGASLRNIVRSVGMTTGALYGYYDSKIQLFEALVGTHYDWLLATYNKAQDDFAKLPHDKQPENMSRIVGSCMEEMLEYIYKHIEEFKLIISCSEGTRFHDLIDRMVDIELKATERYISVLKELGLSSPVIDDKLEHIIITGMFNTFFELVVHEMPYEDARRYLVQMREFYTAGWMKILGT